MLCVLAALTAARGALRRAFPQSLLPDMLGKAAFAQILPLDAGNNEEGASGM